MKKYVYDNAVVYITIPNEEQVNNIHKATESFVKQLIKEGLINNGTIRHSRRIGVSDPHARKRD